MAADTPPPEDSLVVAAFREAEELVDAAFGSGTFAALGRGWDRVFLRRHHTRRSDLDILAAALAGRWKIHDPQVRRQLRRRAESNGRHPEREKAAVLREALKWASVELDRPQRIKLPRSMEGRRDEWTADEGGNLILRWRIPNWPTKDVALGPGRWAMDAAGRTVTCRPGGLPESLRLRWYAAAARRRADDILRGEGPDLEVIGEPVDWVLDDYAPLQEDRAPTVEQCMAATDGVVENDPGEAVAARSPLGAMIASEASHDRLAEVLAVASPRQREILGAMAVRLNNGDSEKEAREAAAAELGMDPATLRVQLHRLRKKTM